jgi:mono/diheme cytochrome c family protein
MTPGQERRMQRHWIFINFGLPRAYRSVKSPFLASEENIREGGRSYRTFCHVCHGAQGRGDGDAARSLAPSPAVLAELTRDPAVVDGYLMWAISDGGVAFDSDMPAYKELLSEDEIWRIIAYMQAGFPD